jgi:hypothetical protein
MGKPQREASGERVLIDSRLAYHLHCLREDATDPEISPLGRLALVRDRVARIREIRQAVENPRRSP